MMSDKVDAERYRRLAALVEAGEWFVGSSKVVDSYGLTEDTYMDDKAMMDLRLDGKEVNASAVGWKKAIDGSESSVDEMRKAGAL